MNPSISVSVATQAESRVTAPVSCVVREFTPPPPPPPTSSLLCAQDVPLRCPDSARRRFAALLLIFAFGLLVAPGVQAQTDPTVQFISSDWSLIPDTDGVSGPDFTPTSEKRSFRLLFVTSGERDATLPDIGVYNSFVQMEANDATGTGAPIAAFKDKFRALISTEALDARDNTATNTDINTDTASDPPGTDTEAPIYWLNGDKIADNYARFYTNSWDSIVPTNQNGDTFEDSIYYVWHGSETDGTADFDPFGDSRAAGMTSTTSSRYTTNPFFPSASGFGSVNASKATESNHLYALSPILTVASADDATLSDLTLADSASTNIPIPLTETFAATTTAYSASVANSVTSIIVTPTIEHSGTVDIASTDADGNELGFTGTGTGPFEVSDLKVGTNIITLTVTAEDTSATTVYTIAVTRAAPRCRPATRKPPNRYRQTGA